MLEIKPAGCSGGKPSKSNAHKYPTSKTNFDTALSAEAEKDAAAQAHDAAEPFPSENSDQLLEQLKNFIGTPVFDQMRLKVLCSPSSISKDTKDDYKAAEKLDEYLNQKLENGYENLTDDEIRKEVSRKYSGGTLADELRKAFDLSQMGIDINASKELLRQGYGKMLRATEDAYGNLPHDSLERITAMFYYAQSFMNKEPNGGDTKQDFSLK